MLLVPPIYEYKAYTKESIYEFWHKVPFKVSVILFCFRIKYTELCIEGSCIIL